MLVELATEGNSEVPGCSAGDSVGGVQGFAAVVGAPAFADLHVLETRLHTGESRVSYIHTHLNHPACSQLGAWTHWEL